MSIKKTSVSIRLEPDVYEKLTAFCQENNIKRSGFLNLLICKYFEHETNLNDARLSVDDYTDKMYSNPKFIESFRENFYTLLSKSKASEFENGLRFNAYFREDILSALRESALDNHRSINSEIMRRLEYTISNRFQIINEKTHLILKQMHRYEHNAYQDLNAFFKDYNKYRSTLKFTDVLNAQKKIDYLRNDKFYNLLVQVMNKLDFVHAGIMALLYEDAGLDYIYKYKLKNQIGKDVKNEKAMTIKEHFQETDLNFNNDKIDTSLLNPDEEKVSV